MPKVLQRESGKVPIPTLYDISGSAHWANKPDLGLWCIGLIRLGSRGELTSTCARCGSKAWARSEWCRCNTTTRRADIPNRDRAMCHRELIKSEIAFRKAAELLCRGDDPPPLAASPSALQPETSIEMCRSMSGADA
jgi:hypothetical protein